MKKYEIKIKGMHCSACATLISINLEEKGFENPNISLDENMGTFYSFKNTDEVRILVQKAIEEAGNYSLESINTFDN